MFLENNTAFSFFNYIFLGKTTADQNKQQIIKHELVHVQQKHSLDLLLFELQRIVCWFNPFSYIYQHRISELHEFIADSKSIKETDKTTYFNNLLAETFSTQHISFINPFFKHSLIKKRIVMLHKNKSKQFLKLKYLLLLPILASMLVYTSCEKGEVENKNQKRLISLFNKSNETGKTIEIQSKQEGYFDMYAFGAMPASGKEIFYNDLTEEEKLDYKKFIKPPVEGEGGKQYLGFKIYKMKDGKKAICQDMDWKGMKDSSNEKDYSNAAFIPFDIIDQSPNFPGCENDKDSKSCFKDKIQEHVQTNFDMSIATTLGLTSSEKKVYVQFTIDKNGAITNVRARGPHEILEKEAIRVMQLLPSMQSGAHNGKKVDVKYTLPITLTM